MAQSRRANSRQALLDAAFEEFSENGYEAATVAAIAARAGVTTGALYAHFDGKLDLLLATVSLAPIEEIVGSIGLLASLPVGEATDRIVAGLSARPDPRMLLLLDVIVVARRVPRVAAILRQGLESYLDAMTAANEAGVQVGLLDPELEAGDVARVLALLNLGMVVVGALHGPTPSTEAFAQLARLLLRPGEHDGADGPAALARVRTRAGAASAAQHALHDGVLAAVRAGHSLRTVGAAAGLSHERVRQLVRQHG